MGNTQRRSVIQWEDEDPEVLFSRWTEDGDEVKNASKLIVGPGQGCVLVLKGKLAAVTEEEGVSEIKTGNTPFLTNLASFMQGFESERKVGIWFYRRGLLTDQKFGTPLPVKYTDPVYDFPVGLRAFGNYSFRVSDAAAFFRQITGSQDCYLVEEARKLVNSRLVQPLTEALAQSRFSYAEVDANRAKISELMTGLISEDLKDLGLEVVDFRIDGTSFDEDTTRRIGRISDMKAEAHAADAVGMDYAGLKVLDAATAAKKEAPDPVEALRKLKQLREQDLIDQGEYEARKKAILDRMEV